MAAATAATKQQRGGARPGAGRKPTREKFARPVAAAEKKIADRLPEIVDAAIELALGVTVQEVNDEGEERVYSRPPCYRSTQYLIDRILGKPTLPIEGKVQSEVSGPGGGPIQVSSPALQAAEAELSEWRKRMNEELLNSQSAPPTSPTSPTPTE